MSKTVHFLLILTLVICFEKCLADECIKTSDSCVCQTNSRKINFRDLNLPANNYKFTTTGGGGTFYYNPCLKFNIQTIQDATVAQQQGPAYYKLGDMNIVYSGDPDTDTLALNYEFQDSSGNDRKTHVDVKCDENENGIFSFIEEKPTNSYKFLLKTKIVCKENGKSSGGLSTGSVLVIIFFVLLIVYWLGGFLFLKFVRKAEGSETIPNIEFWRDFPLLVRDGIHFCVNGCKTESSYEKI